MSEEVKAIDPATALNEVRAKVEEKVTGALEARMAELTEKINAQIRSIAAELKPKVEVVSTPETELRAVADAMIQKRAITLNGAGAYNVLTEIFKVVDLKYDLLTRVRKIYGAGAQTNIPVLTARPAKPSKPQFEGATGIAADSMAAMGATTITPYAYFSEVPISAEAIVQGAANIAGELPSIFADAFAAAMMFGMLDGTGDGVMTSLFTDGALTKDINCEVAGIPAWKDFIGLAGKAKAYAHKPVIITNSTFVGELLSSTAASVEGLKMELLTRSNIRGVEVIESDYAPATYAAGNVVAVALDLSNYVFAIAREMTIEPVKAPGTAVTYYQAVNFMNAKPVLAANGWQLKAV